MQVCWQSCMQHQLGFCNISRFEIGFFFFLSFFAAHVGDSDSGEITKGNFRKKKKDEKWGHVVSSVLVIVLTQCIKCYRNLQLNLSAIYKCGWRRNLISPAADTCRASPPVFPPAFKWDGISIHPIAENLPLCETSLNQNLVCVCWCVCLPLSQPFTQTDTQTPTHTHS